ncbi:MAG: hypothetical protein NTW32_23205 [Chloroflexi bacterium]|nr:hypothetical protein [Chloroflexota bacterium]
MKNNKIVTLFLILAIALMSFACTIFAGGPEYPPTKIAISTEAVGNLDAELQAAQTASVESGVLSITINETQITSLLANKLNSQPDPFIKNPQVYLQNGEIQVFGQATQGNLMVNVRIILQASIDPEGMPVLTITSADFGPFPAPEGLNKTVSSFIDQAFTGAIGPAATGLRIETINIADGIMTLTGKVK